MTTMRRYEVTECVFPVDPSWADFSVHRYELGEFSFLVGRRAAREDEPPGAYVAEVESQLVKARRMLPRYNLLFRHESDQPVVATLHVGHEFEEKAGVRVELQAYFTLNGTHFAVQCAGPGARRAECEQVMSMFVDTFRTHEEGA